MRCYAKKDACIMNTDFRCYRSSHVGGQRDVTWKRSIAHNGGLYSVSIVGVKIDVVGENEGVLQQCSYFEFAWQIVWHKIPAATAHVGTVGPLWTAFFVTQLPWKYVFSPFYAILRNVKANTFKFLYMYRMEYWQNVTNGSLFSEGRSCSFPATNNLPRRLSS